MCGLFRYCSLLWTHKPLLGSSFSLPFPTFVPIPLSPLPSPLSPSDFYNHFFLVQTGPAVVFLGTSFLRASPVLGVCNTLEGQENEGLLELAIDCSKERRTACKSEAIVQRQNWNWLAPQGLLKSQSSHLKNISTAAETTWKSEGSTAWPEEAVGCSKREGLLEGAKPSEGPLEGRRTPRTSRRSELK